MQDSTRQAISFLHKSHLLLSQALDSVMNADRKQPSPVNEALALDLQKTVDTVVGYIVTLAKPEYPNIWVEGKGFDLKILGSIIDIEYYDPDTGSVI